MKITIQFPEFPETLLAGQTRTKTAKRLTLEAIQNELTPIPLPDDQDLQKVSINFLKEDLPLIEKARSIANSVENLKKKDGDILSGFCFAATQQYQQQPHSNHIQQEPQPYIHQVEQLSEHTFRPEQELLYTSAKKNLFEGKIVLGEASTGVGKSRVLGQLALDLVKNKKGPVVIAAPTINVVKHLVEEFLKLPTATDISSTVVLGKNQFIDPYILSELLPEFKLTPEKEKEVRVWLQNGCPPIKGNDTEFLAELQPDLSYLQDDLITLAPELESVTGLTLNADSNDNYEISANPGFENYKFMRESAVECSIIFTTHSMLALDIRLKRINEQCVGLLNFKSLLVDEAHSLEDAIANIETSSCSILSLKTALSQTKIGSALGRKRAKKICENFSSLAKEIGSDQMVWPYDWQRDTVGSGTKNYFNLITELAMELEGLLKKKSKKIDSWGYLIQSDLIALRKVLKKNQPTLISVSPVRNFPSIVTGPTSINYALEHLWSISLCAGLFSATLFLPEKHGCFSSTYIAKKLNIPSYRLEALFPIFAPWVTTSVTLKIPPKKELPDLQPPTENDFTKDTFSTANDAWLKNIADKIASISNAAKGGTLVLLTSYEAIHGIYNHLKEKDINLIVHQRNLPFAKSKGEFISAYRVGDKPVWLALGPAWTGLDLSEKEVPAEKDFLLTDLIIPRIPFGLTHSLTHKSRARSIKQDDGYKILSTAPKKEAAFSLRQGIGRLIRRPGVKERNLWVLDSRIWLKNKKYYSIFQQILEIYKK